MAKLNDISSINKIFRDAPSFNKASLIIMDERRDKRLQPGGEHFGGDFGRDVLQRDWAKVGRRGSAGFLRD